MPSIRGLVLFASLGCAIQLQFAVTLSSTPKSGTKGEAAINVGNGTNNVTSSNDTRSLTVNSVNSTQVQDVNNSALNQSRTQPGVLNTTTQENVSLNRTELRHVNTSSGNSTVANNSIQLVNNTDCQIEMKNALNTLHFILTIPDFYLIYLPNGLTNCQNVTIGVRFAPIDEIQGCPLHLNFRWTNWTFPDNNIDGKLLKMNKSQQMKNSNKIYHVQYGFGRREDFVNKPQFDTPIYTNRLWEYFGTKAQSELSVRADAIPKVLNVGDNLTINCTAEGFPKPLTDLDINYGVNDSEYHYSHRKGDVFYFDEVILPTASYKCSACQYVVISSNGKGIKISATTEIADVEVTVYTTSTSTSTGYTPSTSTSTVYASSTSTPTVYAPSTSTPTPSLPPTPSNFCDGLPPDLCGNQSAILKEFDEELSNFHVQSADILGDSEVGCREAIRTSICFRHYITCPGSPHSPPLQKYCAPNCTVLSSKVCRETWEQYKQFRWVYHLSTCTDRPVTCSGEDPTPPNIQILIGVVFGTMLVILGLVVTCLVVKHCKMNSKKVILKPWKKDAEKPDLPYIFNDDYYKSKYGLVGDYKLSSIPRKNLHIGEVIGEGHFGTVYKALLSRQEADEGPLVVAAKCVNFYGSEEKMKEFFQEARFMGHLDHPNIVKLYGISMSHEPFYLVAEYMCEGDLRHLLQQAAGSIERRLINPDAYKEYSASTSSCNPPLLATHELMYICLQIACGMQYMTEHGHVHRDLAARNCLVGPNLLVKISDFGLSRSLYHKNYYRVHRGAELPVRWLAPEALIRGEFTLDSDVWSFGIVMWEVFSFGHHPYYGRANDEILNLIAQGYILEQPLNCPCSMYTIMQNCWRWDPSQRPMFREIVCTLDSHYAKTKMKVTSSCSEIEEDELEDDVFVEEGENELSASHAGYQTTEV